MCKWCLSLDQLGLKKTMKNMTKQEKEQLLE